MTKSSKTDKAGITKAETENLIENLIDDLHAHGDRYIHADDGAYTVRIVEALSRERALRASSYFDRIVSKLGAVAEYRATLNPDVFDVRSYLPRLLQLALEADEQIREMQDAKGGALIEFQPDSDIPF